MGYLEYQKEELINLNRSLNKEYLRTNRAGSYACSTIINCNTRKYHGLLICPIKELLNQHHVLLSAVDETLKDEEQAFNLGIHKYPNEFNPLGHKYIKSFNADEIPCLTYRVGSIILQKEMLLVEEEERILIRYTVLEASRNFKMAIKPFLAFRNIHDLTYANHAANSKSTAIDKGVKIKLYDKFPFLHMQLSEKNEFVPAPDWYYNISYDKEKVRSDFYCEDLLVPGYFEVEMKKGSVVVFSAGTEVAKPTVLKKKFSSELNKKIPKNDFLSCLEGSAYQFISKNDDATEIVASFPWFGSWGRDSLIALPGLTLPFKNLDTYKNVLSTISSHISGFIYTNKGNIDHSDVESVDTSLWYINAVQKLLPHTTNTYIKKEHGKKIKEILDDISLGKNTNIYPHDNGLLFIPDPNKALTWMESTMNGEPVVKRYGYVVEINSLWYNAICFYLELFGNTKNEKWIELKKKIEKSFSEYFWNEECGCLADCNYNGNADFSIRPNQIFSASLPYSPLTELQKKKVVDIVQLNLLTDKGLRSLSPSHPHYVGSCEGNRNQRAYAYHQGTVWPWMLAPFAEAYLKINGKGGLSLIKRLFHGFESEMHNHGIGSISEVYDGNPPHRARGAISQAWSVAAVLELKMLIEEFES